MSYEWKSWSGTWSFTTKVSPWGEWSDVWSFTTISAKPIKVKINGTFETIAAQVKVSGSFVYKSIRSL